MITYPTQYMLFFPLNKPNLKHVYSARQVLDNFVRFIQRYG